MSPLMIPRCCLVNVGHLSMIYLSFSFVAAQIMG